MPFVTVEYSDGMRDVVDTDMFTESLLPAIPGVATLNGVEVKVLDMNKRSVLEKKLERWNRRRADTKVSMERNEDIDVGNVAEDDNARGDLAPSSSHPSKSRPTRSARRESETEDEGGIAACAISASSTPIVKQNRRVRSPRAGQQQEDDDARDDRSGVGPASSSSRVRRNRIARPSRARHGDGVEGGTSVLEAMKASEEARRVHEERAWKCLEDMSKKMGELEDKLTAIQSSADISTGASVNALTAVKDMPKQVKDIEEHTAAMKDALGSVMERLPPIPLIRYDMLSEEVVNRLDRWNEKVSPEIFVLDVDALVSSSSDRLLNVDDRTCKRGAMFAIDCVARRRLRHCGGDINWLRRKLRVRLNTMAATWSKQMTIDPSFEVPKRVDPDGNQLGRKRPRYRTEGSDEEGTRQQTPSQAEPGGTTRRRRPRMEANIGGKQTPARPFHRQPDYGFAEEYGNSYGWEHGFDSYASERFEPRALVTSNGFRRGRGAYGSYFHFGEHGGYGYMQYGRIPQQRDVYGGNYFHANISNSGVVLPARMAGASSSSAHNTVEVGDANEETTIAESVLA